MAAATLALSAVPGEARAACAVPPRADVLARSAAGVVYATRFTVYGCRHGNPRMKLADVIPDPILTAHMARINGRHAALVIRSHDHYGCLAFHVRSFDLVRRERVVAAEAVRTDCVESIYRVRVDDLAVGRRGSLAFTRWDHGTEQVVRVRRGGRPDVLDSSPTLAPRSLTLSGTRLRWTDGEATRSARLR